MPRITYIEHGGTEHVVDAAIGLSVMRAAIENGVPGIEGICGGQCACATCHCYVDDVWIGQLNPMNELEDEMLAEATGERRANSRLGCQIAVADNLDGIVIVLPERQ